MKSRGINNLIINNLILGLLLFALPTAVGAFEFSDVDVNNPHFEAIDYLKEDGVIEGYEDEDEGREFRPDNTIVRAEALKIILEALDRIDSEYDFADADNKYDDIEEDDWFYPYVITATEMGIVKGYEDGDFKPGNKVTLAETLKMTIEAGGIDVEDFEDEDPVFNDVEEDDWFVGYVNYAQSNNIIVGDYNGRLQPNRNITRAQLSELVYRLVRVKSEKKPYTISNLWKEYKPKNANFRINVAPTWSVDAYDGSSIIWRPGDGANEKFFAQSNLLSTYIAAFQDDNKKKLSQEDYFDQLIKDALDIVEADYTKGRLNSIPYLKIEVEKVETRWFFYFPNGKVLNLIVHLQSDLESYRKIVEIEEMIDSLNYVEKEIEEDESETAEEDGETEKAGSGSEEVLSKIRENILVEGKGEEMVKLLGDGLIIETDTIGVGTGPVDYYYSESFDVTLKYERSADLLLDMMKGHTTAF